MGLDAEQKIIIMLMSRHSFAGLFFLGFEIRVLFLNIFLDINE